MHDVVILSDERLVGSLVEAQGAKWRGQKVQPLAASGADNAMFRLGDKWAVRLPRRPEVVQMLETEATWLPRLADLPLEVPVPRLLGAPTQQFNWPFTIVDWIDGVEAEETEVSDMAEAVQTLATFLKALWKKSTRDAPLAGEANNYRGVNLKEVTQQVLTCFSKMDDEIEPESAREAWLSALDASPVRKPRWLHGDLRASNMIVRDGELVGVVDWGRAAVGDPAADVAVAWRWVPEWEMSNFQEALGASDDLWRRARGWALYDAVVTLAHYKEQQGFEGICDESRCVLGRLGLGAPC